VNLIGRISDKLLGAVVPKVSAAAQYCKPTGRPCGFCSCAGSRAWYHQWWECSDGSFWCSTACEISGLC
jgi:hypothetical protein